MYLQDLCGVFLEAQTKCILCPFSSESSPELEWFRQDKLKIKD